MKLLKGILLGIGTAAGVWMIAYGVAGIIVSTAIKAHNRTFIECMEQMETGGEEIRMAIDSCVIQLHYGEQ